MSHHLRNPLPRTPRYAGRHVARRRRVVGPVLLAGVIAATTVVSAAPQTAATRARVAQGTVTAPSVASDPTREARASRSEERTTVYRVVPGRRLRVRPPSYVLPVADYRLTGRFGQTSGLWARSHTGLDFAAPEGTQIRSVGAGTVVSASYAGPFGILTVVRLLDGTVLWYAHQSAADVRPGQRVATGQVIGHIGATGNVTGPHLHLEVHPKGGAPVDPEDWLPSRGLRP